MENNKVYTKEINILIRLIPIIILIVFYLFTIIIFEFGPNFWPVNNKFLLYSYLFLAYTFMFIGYLFSIRNKIVTVKKDNLKIFTIFLLLFIIVLPITSYGRTGNFIPDLFVSNFDYGSAYYGTRSIRTAWPEYIRMFIGPALFAVLPLGIYLWPKLNFKIKLFYSLAIIFYLAIDISRGTNKTVAEFILLLITIGLTQFLIKNKKWLYSKVHFNKRILIKLIKNILGSLVLIVIFFKLFTLFISSRTTSTYNKYTDSYIDFNNIFLNLVSDDTAKYGIAKIMSYLSQGYYGLALALEKPFYFTGGFGYSSFLLENLSFFGLEDIKHRTYAYRLVEDNWPTGEVWSSFFVWPASDISFFGVLVLMFFIGYILGSSWLDSLLGNNYIAVITFSLFCILSFYIPLNNQLFQGGELFITSWFWIGIWGTGKIRRRLK